MINDGIIFGIYAAMVSLVQGIADVWMIDSFVKCRSEKKFANVILILLVVLHDLFTSIFGGKDNYTLLGVEMLVYYPTIFLLFYKCYKGYAHWNRGLTDTGFSSVQPGHVKPAVCWQNSRKILVNWKLCCTTITITMPGKWLAG